VEIAAFPLDKLPEQSPKIHAFYGSAGRDATLSVPVSLAGPTTFTVT